MMQQVPIGTNSFTFIHYVDDNVEGSGSVTTASRLWDVSAPAPGRQQSLHQLSCPSWLDLNQTVVSCFT